MYIEIYTVCIYIPICMHMYLYIYVCLCVFASIYSCAGAVRHVYLQCFVESLDLAGALLSPIVTSSKCACWFALRTGAPSMEVTTSTGFKSEKLGPVNLLKSASRGSPKPARILQVAVYSCLCCIVSYIPRNMSSYMIPQCRNTVGRWRVENSMLWMITETVWKPTMPLLSRSPVRWGTMYI